MMLSTRKAALRGLLGFCVLVLSLGVAQVGSTKAEEQVAAPAGIEQIAYRQNRQRHSSRRAVPQQGGRYFIDFRARHALSYGHTYAAYGRLNARGEIIESHVAGLHPAGDSPVPWMIGHFIPVPSETGASDGDLEAQYIAASYRVTMDEAQYTEMVAYIKKLQATSPLWNAVLYNCNSFVADIARHMGLRAPVVTLVYPATYINALRDMNNGRSVVTSRAI